MKQKPQLKWHDLITKYLIAEIKKLFEIAGYKVEWTLLFKKCKSSLFSYSFYSLTLLKYKGNVWYKELILY